MNSQRGLLENLYGSYGECLADKTVLADNITNSGTYTWRPRLSVPSGEIIPSTKCNNRRGRSFTISIVPDHHVGEANYWPEFAITGLEGKKLSQNCLNIVSGVSTAVPAIIAGGGDNSLRKHSLVAINPPNTAPPASSPTSAAQDSPDNHGSDLSSGAKAAIALGVIVFLLVAAIFGFIWWRLRPKRKGLPTETGDTSAGHQQLPFHGTEDIDTSYQYLPLHETVDTSASHHQPPRSLTVDTYSPTSVEMRPVSTIDPVSPVSPVSTYGPPPPYRYVTKYGTKASPNRDVKPKARRNDGVIVASPEPKHAPATDVPQINDQGQALVGMV